MTQPVQSKLPIIRHAADASLNGTTDAGAVHVITADGVTLTLPAVADGLHYYLLDTSNAHDATLQPQSSDGIVAQNLSRGAGVAIHNSYYANSVVRILGVDSVGWVLLGENTWNAWS